MEERNELIEKFMLRAKNQKKQSNFYLILMLTSFACAVFFFIRLENLNSDIKQAKGYEGAYKRDSIKVGLLTRLLEECKSSIVISDTLKKYIDTTTTLSKYSKNLVYIQTRSNKETIIANKFLQELKSQGFSVPGIDHIDRKFKNRIFYFNDEDRAVAEDVANFLRNTFIQSEQQLPNDLTVMKPGIQAPKGQIEVWINLTD